MRCAAVSRTKRLYPFRIDAWVVLPEHMHAVWTLPEGDAAYSTRWALINRWFSAAIPPGEDRSASRAAKGERGLWQRRFWEHTVRDAEDFSRHPTLRWILAGLVAVNAVTSVVSMLWLSITAPVGLASRPARSRWRLTRSWLINSQVPSSRRRTNRRETMRRGGKPVGTGRPLAPRRRM